MLDDLRKQLRLIDAEVVHMGIDRPNLRLEAIRMEGEAEKRAAIIRVLNQMPGSAIIYTATVKAVADLATHLNENGFSAGAYHGQLGIKARAEVQDRFMSGDLPIMVATNAFGLGIDKPDIRLVIHHHAPGTIEAYYQEAGRAGRDGQPSRCILLHDPADQNLHRFFQAGRYATGEDLVNAHHALKRLGLSDGAPTFTRLKAICPLPKLRLKQALNLFKGRAIVEEKAGEIRLLAPDLSFGELERIAGDYRERNERDLLAQERMARYTETRGCRWSYLFDYFGRDENFNQPEDACGHCDNCG